jgi:hypothetical protein
MARKRIAEQTKGIGKPKVGGPFQLMDHNGKPFSNEDMLGRYSLVRRLRFFFFFKFEERYTNKGIHRSTSASHTALISAPTSSTKCLLCTTK